MGMPSWERLGRISGWAKRRVTDDAFSRQAAVSASLAEAIVVTVVDPIFVSHAPCMRDCQSLILAVGVLGDIVARCNLPPFS